MFLQNYLSTFHLIFESRTTQWQFYKGLVKKTDSIYLIHKGHDEHKYNLYKEEVFIMFSVQMDLDRLNSVYG